MTDSLTFDIWSTTTHLVVTDARRLPRARQLLDAELAGIEMACSRFRPGSEITEVLARPGRDVQISEVLNAAVGAALRVARATDFLVDPTVASAVISLGYDRDIVGVLNRSIRAATSELRPAPGAWQIQHDPARRLLRVPAGVGLDLGATAKALAADRAATRIATELDCGVLVSLGGDIAVGGPAPTGGWLIDIADDHRDHSPVQQTVAITAGGLATSSITTRRWKQGNNTVHHIVDPRTGANPAPFWRTVSATAGSCVDANAVTTAAIVLGPTAGRWLEDSQLAARLVQVDGTTRYVGGWPAMDLAA